MHVLLKAILLIPILIPIWWCWFVISAIPCASIWLIGITADLRKEGNFWDVIGCVPMAPWFFLMCIIKTRYVLMSNGFYVYLDQSHVTGECHVESMHLTPNPSTIPIFPSRRAAQKVINKLCAHWVESKPEDYQISKIRI